MGSVIGMYSNANPADNLANIDVPQDGMLEGVEWACQTAASGADFTFAAEVSFGSTNSLSTNDSRATISSCKIAADLTTSGAAMTSANYYSRLPDIPVFAGERIFLHASGTAITTSILVKLHFSFDEPRASRRRRT